MAADPKPSSRQRSVAPYDDEYTEVVQIAARAIHASDLEHLDTLRDTRGQVIAPEDRDPEFSDFATLNVDDRAFYMRAAGAALTVAWNRGWRRSHA